MITHTHTQMMSTTAAAAIDFRFFSRFCVCLGVRKKERGKKFSNIEMYKPEALLFLVSKSVCGLDKAQKWNDDELEITISA